MTVLIAYFSLSGTTRNVATALAKELAADVEEIRCARYSPGIWGSLRAAYDSWKGNLPSIEPLEHVPSRYDVVVLGGPIWAFHPATPVRAFLRQEASRARNLAFFLTHGGSAAEQSLREMEQIAGRAPIATLVVREADVKKGKCAALVSSFASELRNKQAA
jgi:flavodoxin